jgi:acyl dehydratase
VPAVNPEAEGTTYPAVEFVIEPERVAAFRQLFGQPSGVPPTFLTAAEFVAFPPVLHDPALGLDFARMLHGGQSYELERPLREGETLTVRVSIESVRVRANTGFLVIAMRFDDETGAQVARTRSTMIEQAKA